MQLSSVGEDFHGNDSVLLAVPGIARPGSAAAPAAPHSVRSRTLATLPDGKVGHIRIPQNLICCWINLSN